MFVFLETIVKGMYLYKTIYFTLSNIVVVVVLIYYVRLPWFGLIIFRFWAY